MPREPDDTAFQETAASEGPNPFERIVEEAGHAVYVTDPDGTITYVNPAFESITGYSAEEAIGNTPSILASDQTPKEHFERLWATISGGDVWEREVTNRRKNGERYTAHQTIAPVTTNGKISNFVAIQTDITERKRHQQALERSNDLLAETEQLTGVGGWEYVPETETLRWTDGTRRIHEVADDYEPTLAEALAFYHPEDRDRVEKALDRCHEDGTRWDMEVRLVTAGGRTRWVRVTGKRGDRDGRHVLYGAINDVTARTQREERLMVLNRILRHNLRNDLNVIAGYAEQLHDDIATLEALDDGDVARLAATLDELSDRETLPADRQADLDTLARLVDEVAAFPVDQARTALRRMQESAWDLTTLAEKANDVVERIDHESVGDRIDLRPALEDVATRYREAFPGATIEIDGPNATVRGTGAAVRKVVAELLENALEHTDTESPHARIEVEPLETDRVAISVRDWGPGMPATERQTFAQREETPLVHGSGIGLWLVNWLVRGLGGSVTIEDADPRGTVVRVTLPAGDPADGPKP